MSDYAIVTGDQVMFLPIQGDAMILAPAMIPISGTSKVKLLGRPACLEGDEKKVILPVPYMAGPYVIPGVGQLKIAALAGDQLSKKTSQGKKLILKGDKFDAELQVLVPAMQPTIAGPVPDATPSYKGKGQFITTNLKLKPA